MSPGSSSPPVDLGSLEPGTHLCAFPHDDAEQARIATTFVRHGLCAGDQVLYVASPSDADAMLTGLAGHVDTSDALASGQLVVRSFTEAYGPRRPDDLQDVADGFREAAAQSRKDGFPALRVAAQMDELAPLLGSVEEVARWERISTDLQREIGVSSVCLYGAGRLDDDEIALLDDAHAGRAPEHADGPIASFLLVETPAGLRVSGEVDIANRHLLHRALVARAAVTPRLRLDLRGLTFADVRTLAQFRDVAAGLPDDGWLVLDHPSPVVRRTLDICALHHDRMRLEP